MSYDWEGAISAAPGSAAFFEQSDRRALEAHRPFGHPGYPAEAPYSRLVDWEGVRGRRVLEIGCGLGLHASLFAAAGARVVTVDLTETAAKLARARFVQGRVGAGLARADGERLPFPDASFDQVWSWGVIHHSANTPAIVAEVRRVLKPGGLFRAMVYHRRSVRYWLVGGIQHGIVRGKLLRMTLDEVNKDFTDGAIARHYTVPEARDLLAGFEAPAFRILQEAGSDAVPKLSPLLRRLSPALSARLDAWVNARFGWFLFWEARKPRA
jgi:SAM-dependent methyltransferase